MTVVNSLVFNVFYSEKWFNETEAPSPFISILLTLLLYFHTAKCDVCFLGWPPDYCCRYTRGKALLSLHEANPLLFHAESVGINGMLPIYMVRFFADFFLFWVEETHSHTWDADCRQIWTILSNFIQRNRKFGRGIARQPCQSVCHSPVNGDWLGAAGRYQVLILILRVRSYKAYL